MPISKNLQQKAYQLREKVDFPRLKTIHDIKLFPNDILLSYLTEEINLSSNDLTDLLKDLPLLETLLQSSLPNPTPTFRTLEIKIAELLMTADKEQKFCHVDGVGAIAANSVKEQHTYPSGLIIDYFLLEDESTANISIFDAGYGKMKSKQIFVRKNFVSMIGAMFRVLKKESPDYKTIEDTFLQQIPGIVIAHEYSELNIPEHEFDAYETRLELELRSERGARSLLESQGVPAKFYRLYHELRATTDHKRGKNISRYVLDSL